MKETKSISFLEAKAKLEAYCAYQERCQYEVEQKLILWKFSEEQAQQLIADLIVNRFLDEERFACAYVSGKFRIKNWGRIKIKAHLKQKKISNYSVEKGLKEIDDDEYFQTILMLIKRKKRELKYKKLTPWELKSKLYHFLASKGYESQMIYNGIDEDEFFDANHVQ
ncbi:MAG: RecX family transcriptional regulator [Flavobacteriia bacterium]|nr:RecX family transcriptional regulator [Flavobacteriia bacterium]